MGTLSHTIFHGEQRMMVHYKVVMLGSGGVGKSSLTVRFVHGIFIEKYDPTIEDCYKKMIELDGLQVMIEIIDTAGTEQFMAMRDLYMKSGNAFLLVYSITDLGTLHDLADVREHILRVKECVGDNTQPTTMILIGNKCDKVQARQVTKEEGQAIAREWGIDFFETSALTAVNVNIVFECAVKDLLKKAFPKRRHKLDQLCLHRAIE